MGGLGSGRQSNRKTVDASITLDLSSLLRFGQLTKHRATHAVAWSLWGKQVYTLTFEAWADGDCLRLYLWQTRARGGLIGSSQFSALSGSQGRLWRCSQKIRAPRRVWMSMGKAAPSGQAKGQS